MVEPKTPSSSSALAKCMSCLHSEYRPNTPLFKEIIMCTRGVFAGGKWIRGKPLRDNRRKVSIKILKCEQLEPRKINP